MNSLISLRRATKNDLKFLELLYNDKTIQDISLNVDSGKITEKEINNTLEYFEKNKLDFFIVLERKQPIGITLIYEINKKMIARQNNNLASLGVTVQQALVIAYLDKSKDKKVTQRMIEIGLNNTNPTVTNIIKSMMSKNLIYKIQDKVDKRKYYLYLTPLGLSIASECAKRMEATDIAAYKNLTEEELKTLRVLLEKVEF